MIDGCGLPTDVHLAAAVTPPPTTNNQQPATRNQQPATDNPQSATCRWPSAHQTTNPPCGTCLKIPAAPRRRRRGRRTTVGRAARGGAVALSELRALGHHVARAARRARRPQARAAPHPVHDVAAEPDGRREASQVREGRRRRDGQLPSARRLARSTRRSSAWRSRSRCATRSSTAPATSDRSTATTPRRCATPSAASRASATRCSTEIDQDTVALPAELRRHARRAGRPARAHSEPARQRRHRHRRRHGDQHPAAQPRRGLHGARRDDRRRPRADDRAALPLHQGPGFSDRRPDHEHAEEIREIYKTGSGIDPHPRHAGRRGR